MPLTPSGLLSNGIFPNSTKPSNMDTKSLKYNGSISTYSTDSKKKRSWYFMVEHQPTDPQGKRPLTLPKYSTSPTLGTPPSISPTYPPACAMQPIASFAPP